MPNNKPNAITEMLVSEAVELLLTYQIRTKKELHEYLRTQNLDIDYNQASWIYDQARAQIVTNLTPQYIEEKLMFAVAQYELLFQKCYAKKDYRACVGIIDSIVHTLSMPELAKRLLSQAPEVERILVNENIDDDENA